MKRCTILWQVQFVPGQKMPRQNTVNHQRLFYPSLETRWGLLTCWWWSLPWLCSMLFESSIWVKIKTIIKSFIWAFENEVIPPQILCRTRQVINISLCEQVSKQHTFWSITLAARFIRLISLLNKKKVVFSQVHSRSGGAAGVGHQEFSCEPRKLAYLFLLPASFHTQTLSPDHEDGWERTGLGRRGRASVPSHPMQSSYSLPSDGTKNDQEGGIVLTPVWFYRHSKCAGGVFTGLLSKSRKSILTSVLFISGHPCALRASPLRFGFSVREVSVSQV